jgi:hypothetical protein
MFYKEEDLPEEIRKILQEPCSACGKKGIHECKYNEEVIKARLEKEAKEKKKLKPDVVVRKDNSSGPKQYKYNSAPTLGTKCKKCDKSLQTVDGFCYACTIQRREGEKEVKKEKYRSIAKKPKPKAVKKPKVAKKAKVAKKPKAKVKSKARKRKKTQS